MTEDQDLERHIETIARWIIGCEHVVAFTGAGISIDSGLPDFRGPEGVWTRRPLARTRPTFDAAVPRQRL
jgi:NAD-dependent deacetylase